MTFKYLPNLTCLNVEDCHPWEMGLMRPQFANKTAYRHWCDNPNTIHAFFSGIVGDLPSSRVNKDNPPAHMVGLVLDYDAVPPSDPAALLLAAAPSDLRPSHVSRTFSGNCRVLYKFQAPVPLFTPEITEKFLKKVARELKLRKLLAGFDIEELLDVAKYFEVGDDWQPVGDGAGVIPTNLLVAWMVDASRHHNWTKDGPAIPAEALREAGRDQFGEQAWGGDWSSFDIGQRGRRFWDVTATDPTSVIVRESGCQFFSEGGGFKTWEQIFGADFVRKWRDDRLGAAVGGIWFDGTLYWMRQPDGTWTWLNEHNVRLHLHVEHRLSNKPGVSGSPSEIAQALHAIQKMNRVAAAMPFIFQPSGLYQYNGRTFLNISNVKAVVPVSDAITTFGDRFPRIAALLATLFDPVEQLDYFLSWLSYFYVGAVREQPRRGLALFIAGPVGAGKSLLGKAILGQLMGGRQDAGLYLLKGDKFNSGIFNSAVWTLDDEVIAEDPKQRSQFTQMTKKIVANDSFSFRAMYRAGEDLEWIGRIVVTMNDDVESLQMLPETDRNILDKIMLLRVKKPEIEIFPTDEQIAAELPYFGAYLRDWPIPEHCKGGERFGTATFHHPALLASAAALSDTSNFQDLLNCWRKDYFAAGGPGESEPNWCGTPTALLQTLCANESLRLNVQRNFGSGRSIGMRLHQLIKKTPPCTYIQNPADRRYTIARP